MQTIFRTYPLSPLAAALAKGLSVRRPRPPPPRRKPVPAVNPRTVMQPRRFP